MADVLLTALQGDTVDGLLWRAARMGPAAVPAVLAANRGLSAQLTLDGGQQVILPAALVNAPSPANAASKPVRRVRLWS